MELVMVRLRRLIRAVFQSCVVNEWCGRRPTVDEIFVEWIRANAAVHAGVGNNMRRLAVLVMAMWVIVSELGRLRSLGDLLIAQLTLLVVKALQHCMKDKNAYNFEPNLKLFVVEMCLSANSQWICVLTNGACRAFGPGRCHVCVCGCVESAMRITVR